MDSANVPHIPIVIDENDITAGASKIIEVIRPTWKKEDLLFKLLTDGITNKLVRCSLNNNEKDVVLVRIYGNKTDLLIDRKAETRNILLLGQAGLAPQLYATFQNGLAYEYVAGCTLDDKSVVQPHIYKLVAKQMARLHKVNVPHVINPEPIIWKKLDDFLNLVPEVFSDCEKHKRFVNTVPSKQKIKEEIVMLRTKLESLDNQIVFAHNDLLLGNIIYTQENNSVTFIDYEYAAYNYQAFDIGNHFAEFVGIDNVDYSKYPSRELQFDWLRAYLSEFYNTATVEDKFVEMLYTQVNQFALLTHIFWGVWALIQAEYSYIDFDFMGYAAIRFNEYFSKKDEFLSLEMSR